MISLGIDELLRTVPAELQDKRLGLLCNQASVDRRCQHSKDLINKTWPGGLTCLFSPQHGFFAEKQDNMKESAHGMDAALGIPVFSLYGEERKPTAAMLDLLDVLLIDLIDVGTRVYTFIHTLSYCLEAAAESGKQVIVLDRPNPLGGEHIEGNMLADDCRSFVGLHPLPMRHGLTIGEMALSINSCLDKKADLRIIPMGGWQRSMFFADTGLPWIFPSPNMPSPHTALVYPGQVLWEGTNISEGRGTTLPFELFGAPFFRHNDILTMLSGKGVLKGCILRPVAFEPTANKFNGQTCTGFHMQVTDNSIFRSYLLSLALLQTVIKLYPDDFQYKEPPYEYEYERLPLDLIIGDTAIRKAVAQGADLLELEQGWQPDLMEFDRRRREFFLYHS